MPAAGAPHVRVEQDVDDLPFHPGDWPLRVMGSGLRRVASDLCPGAGEVLDDTVTWASDRARTSVRVRSIYTIASRDRERS